MSLLDRLIALNAQLHPTGRAHRDQKRKVKDSLDRALMIGEERALNNAYAIFHSILPDNQNFTAEDASDWERRLGLPIDPNIPLSDRKVAIERKMNHPGDIPGRQAQVYLEGKLKEANFQVEVYQNWFDDGSGGMEAKFPDELFGYVHSDDTYHGAIPHGGGGTGFDIIANHVDPAEDLNEIAPNGLNSLRGYGRDGIRDFFYIGPSGLQFANKTTTYAQIPSNRRTEFRDLVLKLKPAQSIALVFVEYT